VAKLDNPELDVASYQRQIRDMADELGARLTASDSEEKRWQVLTNYLFAENGFHGSRTDYYNRANSYVSDVLDDREGIPITLSILFLELAQRIGLTNVAGASLPGHFAVHYFPADGESQLIDVFSGGNVMSRAEAEELAADHGTALTEQHLAPAPKKDIVIRMLNNLLGIAQQSGPPADVLRYLDVLVALNPAAAADRGMRAMVRWQNDDPQGAREDLKWLIDHDPPGIDMNRITELYEALAR
jgi:regulator of sirC expression with transglutaminase-like and TPR domain